MLFLKRMLMPMDERTAASKMQSAFRGKHAREDRHKRQDLHDAAQARALAALEALYNSCDLCTGGASVSELEERVAADSQLVADLDATRGHGAEKLLHALELGRWLHTDGRITLAELLAAALGTSTPAAK